MQNEIQKQNERNVSFYEPFLYERKTKKKRKNKKFV